MTYVAGRAARHRVPSVLAGLSCNTKLRPRNRRLDYDRSFEPISRFRQRTCGLQCTSAREATVKTRSDMSYRRLLYAVNPRMCEPRVPSCILYSNSTKTTNISLTLLPHPGYITFSYQWLYMRFDCSLTFKVIDCCTDRFLSDWL